jgi:hypothetical protein
VAFFWAFSGQKLNYYTNLPHPTVDVIAAVLSARSSYRFNPQWSIDLTADAWPGSDDSYYNVASMVRYRVTGQVRYSFY